MSGSKDMSSFHTRCLWWPSSCSLSPGCRMDQMPLTVLSASSSSALGATAGCNLHQLCCLPHSSTSHICIMQVCQTGMQHRPLSNISCVVTATHWEQTTHRHPCTCCNIIQHQMSGQYHDGTHHNDGRSSQQPTKNHALHSDMPHTHADSLLCNSGVRESDSISC